MSWNDRVALFSCTPFEQTSPVIETWGELINLLSESRQENRDGIRGSQ